jgi:protein-S-isoprenylcysteine O-methyltransferase Ste14
MKKTKFERARILSTRIAVAIGFIVICFSTSHWDRTHHSVSVLLFLAGLVLVAIASLGRMWCSLYIAGYKDRKLVTDGPYSLCRNPLYFFSMLGALGIALATETFTFPLVVIVLFALYYPQIIKREETRLRQMFGTKFDEYTQRTPAFFPRTKSFSEPESYDVQPSVYRKHIFSALWFIWIVGILELHEGLIEAGLVTPLWSFY